MSNALVERPVDAPVVTSEQLDLIRRTVAKDATSDELKLYLYDCARQDVHPLDRLIHFTKRGGKYTPITSIDFMRTRAADTGEYAGSDDAVFQLQPSEPSFAATVTVWRLVQGQRCSFTATARWAEYCPASGQDHMWRKMPHTMLAKCAEALALRKGFPRQLAGLYAKEEMDQADSPRGYVVEAPAAFGKSAPASDVDLPADGADAGAYGVAPSRGDSERCPPGTVLITKVEAGYPGGKVKGFLSHTGQAGGEDKIAIFRDELLTLASEVCQRREFVHLEIVTSANGKPYVKAIRRVRAEPPPREADVLESEPPF